MRSARSSAASGRPRGGSASSSSATSTPSGPRASWPTPRRRRSSTTPWRAAGVPEFTITLNNRKILDGLLDHARPRRPDGAGAAEPRQAREGRPRQGRRGAHGEGSKREAAPEAEGERPSPAEPLTTEQVDRLLDFVERGRGGIEVLAGAEAELGDQPRAVEGIANLRAIFDLLEAAEVPGRSAQDRPRAGAGGSTTTRGSSSRRRSTAGSGSAASPRGGGTTTSRASSPTASSPGVGASIGLDRLLALMEEAGWLAGTATTAPVLVANFPEVGPATAFGLAARLRAAGIGAEVFPDADPARQAAGLRLGPRAQAGRHRRAGRARPRGLQPPQPRHPAGDTGRSPGRRPGGGRRRGARRRLGGRVMTPGLGRRPGRGRTAHRPGPGDARLAPGRLRAAGRAGSASCSTASRGPGTTRCGRRSSSSPSCTSARAARGSWPSCTSWRARGRAGSACVPS